MVKTIATLVAIAGLLCGCVLQSRVPRYTDAEAELVLGMSGGSAQMSSWRDGKWVTDRGDVRIDVRDRHYEAWAESSSISLHFIPLKGSWYVLQAIEADKSAVYMLAKVTGQSAEAYALSCSDLKKNTRLEAWISFESEDCFINPDAPKEKLFTALLATPGEPSSRLEIIR
jgi:hypothetical protein